MKIEMSLSQEQKQTLSATQIQSLQLLAMDNFELRQMMEKEYLENPLLEYERHHSPVSIQNGYVTDEIQQKEMPSQEQSLQKFIISQLNMRKYSRKEWKILKFLIDNLDDNGFFTADEQDMAALCGTSADTIHALLTDLKKLEPCGIFARDLRECLLLQLYARGMPDPLVKVLICDHLEALGRGDIRSVSKALSLPAAQIRKALGQIASLNPRPLNGLDTTQTHYVIPDILLNYDRDNHCFQVDLNDDWFADYHISDYYLQMVHQTEDPELRQYFEKRYLRAKSLIEGIEQRRQTLLALGHYVASAQSDFLLGRGSRVPLTMTEAAAYLNIAVSTVSRAVKGKYVQYPGGCILFKSLFETPIGQNQNAPAQSRDEVKAELKRLFDEEDKQEPLSDTALADILCQQGFAVSRRTVAKYRDSMGIKGCFQRKAY